MGRRSKVKGSRFERELARILRDIWPNAKRRGFTQTQSREECDIEGTPFCIEAKCGKAPNIRRAWGQVQQIKQQNRDPRPALLVYKDDRKPIISVLSAQDYTTLFPSTGRGITVSASGSFRLAVERMLASGAHGLLYLDFEDPVIALGLDNFLRLVQDND